MQIQKKGNVFTHFYMHSAVHLSFYCYTNLVLVRGLNQLPRLLVGESKNKSCKKQVFQSKGEITRSNRISVYTRGPLLTLFLTARLSKAVLGIALCSGQSSSPIRSIFRVFRHVSINKSQRV